MDTAPLDVRGTSAVIAQHHHPGAQWETFGLCEKLQKARHVVLSFDGARRGSRVGAAAWVLWVRDEAGSFEKVSHGGRLLRDISAMVAEREALRMGIECLAVLLPTKMRLFDFEMENSDRTVQYKLDAQSPRLFGQHR